jgi:thioredoxin-related protein
MKKIIFLIIPVFLFILLTNLYGQNIYSFNSGLEAARSSNKLILVNIYDESNSWYKKMENNVYSSGKVNEALNNYIYIKLDAKSNDTYTYGKKNYTADELAKVLGATGYPTHVLMTPDGKVISFKYDNETVTSFSGFIDEENFIEFLGFFQQGKYRDNDLIIIFQN